MEFWKCMIVTCMQSARARMNLRLSKRQPPFITVCSGTKMAAGTNAGTEFPFNFKEMSGVTALPSFLVLTKALTCKKSSFARVE